MALKTRSKAGVTIESEESVREGLLECDGANETQIQAGICLCVEAATLNPPEFCDLPCRKIKTNYFIVSLAFADLLVSVLVMPFGAIELVQDNWIYGEMFCLVRTSLDVLLTTASILHLCCISLDR